MVLLYLYIICFWRWCICSVVYPAILHTVLVWTLALEFIRTVFVVVKLQFLPTTQRNIGQELSGSVWVYGVFTRVSSIINCNCCVSPLAACSFRVHRLWPWKGVNDKKNIALRKTFTFSCRIIPDLFNLLFFVIFAFQIWKTSSFTEEAPFQSVKVKE